MKKVTEPGPSLNPTAASLLGLLDAYGPLTGADLARTAQLQIGDFWSITRSQIYRELAGLEARELIEPEPRGPRDARPYAVTDAGRTAFLGWLDRELPPETIRIPLLLVLSFGARLPPERLHSLLEAALATSRRRLADYRSLDRDLADADPYVRATLSFGMHYEEAVQRWLTSLPPQVRGTAQPPHV